MKISELLNKIDIPKDEAVYYPSDDTFLFLDYLDSEMFVDNYFNCIIDKKRNNSQVLPIIINILDMGAGTGILGFSLLYKILSLIVNNEANPRQFKINIDFIDINPQAIILTKKFVQINSCYIIELVEGRESEIIIDYNFIQSDLLKNFNQTKFWDFIIFNPPYLPSEDVIIEGKNKEIIDWSWDGGSDSGNKILLNFLGEVQEFITNSTLIYFITSSFADKKELDFVLEKFNFQYSMLMTKHIFFEDIMLISATKTPID